MHLPYSHRLFISVLVFSISQITSYWLKQLYFQYSAFALWGSDLFLLCEPFILVAAAIVLRYPQQAFFNFYQPAKELWGAIINNYLICFRCYLTSEHTVKWATEL